MRAQRRGVAAGPNPFPRTDAGTSTDIVAILVAEFLADQVAAEIIAEERARGGRGR